MQEQEVTKSNGEASQQEANKIWGAFWVRERKDYLDEIARMKVVNLEKLRTSYFSHRVFEVGYPVFKKYLPQTSGLSVLDIGTGSGRYGLKIACDFPTYTVTMTDIIPEALSYVEAVAGMLAISNIATKQEDSRRLSFPDASFDIVISDAAIQYVVEYEKTVAEMARVLRPGGVLIISTVNTWNLPHTIHKWWVGKRYLHGWEKSFTHAELGGLCEKYGVAVTAWDGYYFAYGLYRLGYLSKWFRTAARIANRLAKFIDAITGGIIDRYGGFQLIVVGKKKTQHAA